MKKARFGMWLFLSSELMFFSAFFMVYCIYRYAHGVDFKAASGHMEVELGLLNTAILLGSSWMMALALHKRRKVLFLSSTFFLGIIFLSLKFYEYYQHWKDGIFPGLSPEIHVKMTPAEEMFMNLYVLGTGLHAIHMIIGLLALICLIGLFFLHKNPTKESMERMGLYWHFVDIVWLFLYPLFYLLGVSK